LVLFFIRYCQIEYLLSGDEICFKYAREKNGSCGCGISGPRQALLKKIQTPASRRHQVKFAAQPYQPAAMK
jgi:hypothetical protein